MAVFTPLQARQAMQFVKKTSFNSALGWVLVTAMTFASPAQAISLSEVFANSGSQQVAKDKPLPVNQAFQVIPSQSGEQITVKVEIVKGYYAYRDKLKIELPQGVTASPWQFNIQPTYVDDPDFGRVPVFEQSFVATTTLQAQQAVTDTASAMIKWQGCAKAGLCYPPEKTPLQLTGLSSLPQAKALAKTFDKKQPSVASTAPVASQTTTSKEKSANPSVVASAVTISNVTNIANVANPTASAPSVVKSDDTSSVASSTATGSVTSQTTPTDNSTNPTSPANINNPDIFGLAEHTGLALLLLFLAGLGLAFTPCVLPMLPIVANIVARQHNPSAKKGLLLTGGYGLGVATSYGLIGALVAVFGQSLGLMNMLQNPVILLSFAGLFVLLGLYMMDSLPIRLPVRVTMQLQRLTQVGENRLGSVTGSFITGFFSALVVSPCVSAPLAGALAGVATLGNPVIGFLALFLLGLGLSTPLIILGATQGNFMPKAGEWMNWVKKGFALSLFAVALLMVERVFQSVWILGLWALWFAVVTVWAWQWAGRVQLLTRAVAFLTAIWTICLVVGMALGNTDSWQPLKSLSQNSVSYGDVNQNADHQSATLINANNVVAKPPLRVHTLAELQPILASHPKVLVDVTASWCIECRIMDKTLFASPPASLADWQVVKLDVTEDNANSRQVYQELQVFGPPVLLYYQQGKLVERQNGEVKRPDFEKVLAKL
ncbi:MULTISPECIES: protein-disulfide reductase DsbD [unclassified Moraxella]|uniref:protein-disulfide reductase DsbD n=1 Tax=unclassified Moraxella TaxID=2685852 RepID=UPI003AF44878